MHRIHARLRLRQDRHHGDQTVDDIFDKRAGVCQDFAHLTLACLRSHGLAARYVSGYLATDAAAGPGAGRRRRRLARLGGGVARRRRPWLALDPTNDQWADDRYVTVAWGRDYGDVAPVKGVIFTEAKRSTLRGLGRRGAPTG